MKEKIEYYEKLIAKAKNLDTTEYTLEEINELNRVIARMEWNLQLFKIMDNVLRYTD